MHFLFLCAFSLVHLLPVKGYQFSPQTTAQTASVSKFETVDMEQPVVTVLIDPSTTKHGFHKDNQDSLLVDDSRPMTINLMEGRKLVDIAIPFDPRIITWTKDMTINNAPTMYLPPGARPNPTIRTLYTARTTRIACWTKATHTATLLARPAITGTWVTRMTFSKTSRGHACGDNPPYAPSISRCMARFTTPWTVPIATTRAGQSSSTWKVTVLGPHFGNTDPAKFVNDQSENGTLIDKVANWPCFDEIGCEKLCERQAEASRTTAIILGCVLASTVLLFPVVYFKRHPKHLKNLRRRAKDGTRRSKRDSKEASTGGQPTLEEDKGNRFGAKSDVEGQQSVPGGSS